MWWMLAAMVVQTAVSSGQASASAASQRAVIDKNKYDTDTKISFLEESVKTERLNVELSFLEDYGSRLKMLNESRSVQLVTAGASMITADSLFNMQQADEAAFDFDDKMAKLNQEIAMSAVELDNTMKKMGYESDKTSLAMANKAVDSELKWARASTAASAFSTYAAYNTSSTTTKTT